MVNRFVAVIIGLIVIGGAVGGGLYWKRAYDRSHQPQINQTPSSSANTQTKQDDNTMGGLQITDEKVGDGPQAQTGQTVTVNYVGTLTNGTKFDSSYDRNQPFDFTLGAGQVIKGWDQGVVGMKVGGKRKLVIPPDLAYGSQSPSPQIPPNSTLVFEIELLAIK